MNDIDDHVTESAIQKEQQLRGLLNTQSPLLIAYSGGVDSAYLTYVAHQELQHNMLAVLALSSSLAAVEKERAVSFLTQYHIPYRIVNTEEIQDENYVKNDKNRCFYCKSALFDACQQIADELNWHHIAYGFNYDDAQDFRPGQLAAQQRQILRPLYDCGMTKNDIRLCSKQHHLKDYDRPAQPCLASRLFYGTKVTFENLNIVEKVEITLQQLGFNHCRARFDGVTVKIEVPIEDLNKITLPTNRNRILDTIKSLQVKFVTLDLEGLQSGKLNRLLQDEKYV